MSTSLSKRILPAYLEMEPSYYYATILIIGISLSFIWRATGRYEKTDNNCVYVKKAKEITYTYNVKAHACAFGQTALAIFAMIVLFYVVFPVEDYKIVRTRSEAKEQTDDIFETLDHQDDLQTKYTGGTVVHIFGGERISDTETVKNMVKKICENLDISRPTYVKLLKKFNLTVNRTDNYRETHQHRYEQFTLEDLKNRFVEVMVYDKISNNDKLCELIDFVDNRQNISTDKRKDMINFLRIIDKIDKIGIILFVLLQ
mgnify:CR=1 FL=1